MKAANRNLVIRVVSAGVLIPGLLTVVLWPTPEPMAICVHLAVVIGLVEFYWIALRDDPVWMRVVGTLLGLLFSATMYWCPRADALTATMIGVTLATTLLHLIRYGDLPTAAARTGLMIFGILYVPLLLTPLALLKRMPDGSDWIFLVMTVTWFSDTGAYFTGRALGRHKLYRSISPGKSVEGAVGGLASSVGAR
jgi:phosphatidate cytidylyltransferase